MMDNKNVDISVFICSRGRIIGLKEAVKSTIEKADYPHRIEILLRIDKDDTETVDFVTTDLSKKYPQLKTFIEDPFDFKDLWVVYKDLAAMCRGDIIIPFTDDYYVVKNGWDTRLLQFREECLVISAHARLAITRKAYEKYEYINTMTGKNDALDQRIVSFAFENGFHKRIGKWYVRNDNPPIEF